MTESKKRPINVLLIEDDRGYARLIREMIEDRMGGYINSDHVISLGEGLDYLENNDVDVVLLDLILPDSEGLDTFLRVNQAAPDISIVILTSIEDEQVALEALKAGVQDYLYKGEVNPSVLVRAIRYAIERHRTEERIRQSEERLRTQFQALPIPTYIWQKTDNDFILIGFNDSAKEFTDGRISALVGKNLQEVHHDNPEVIQDIQYCYSKKNIFKKEMLFRFWNVKKVRYCSLSYAYVPPDSVILHTEDITDQKLSQEELKKSKDELEQHVRERTEELVSANEKMAEEIAERRRMEDLLKREREAFHILAEASIHTKDISDLCQWILTSLVVMMEFDFGAVHLYNEETNQLKAIAVVGLHEGEAGEKMPDVSLDDTRYISAHVARTRETIFASDVRNHEDLKNFRSRIFELAMSSLITMPITDSEGTLIGVIQLVSRKQKNIAVEERLFFHMAMEIFTNIFLRKRSDEQRGELTTELEHALSENQTLRELLPVCARCKRVRDDDEYRNKINEYIAAHTTVDLGSGICPDCIAADYPNVTKKAT
ncbi:MAG: response regulator [Deltaproteobacteria bacterium]|nr:response regulator [Candidatus Zymogenaceae bacterium]